MSMEDRRVLSTVNKYWAIIAGVAIMGSTAVVGYLHLQWTVASIQQNMDSYKSGADARREANREELDNIRLEIKEIETNLEWVKATTNRRSHD